MKIEFPLGEEKIDAHRLSEYLNRVNYPHSQKKVGGVYHFEVEVKEAVDAFWLGRNVTALLNKEFDGPLTQTL